MFNKPKIETREQALKFVEAKIFAATLLSLMDMSVRGPRPAECHDEFVIRQGKEIEDRNRKTALEIFDAVMALALSGGGQTEPAKPFPETIMGLRRIQDKGFQWLLRTDEQRGFFLHITTGNQFCPGKQVSPTQRSVWNDYSGDLMGLIMMAEKGVDEYQNGKQANDTGEETGLQSMAAESPIFPINLGDSHGGPGPAVAAFLLKGKDVPERMTQHQTGAAILQDEIDRITQGAIKQIESHNAATIKRFSDDVKRLVTGVKINKTA